MRGPLSEEQVRSLADLLTRGEKGEAVRRYRQLSGEGPMEAAEFMEDLSFKLKSEKSQPKPELSPPKTEEIPIYPPHPEAPPPVLSEAHRQEIDEFISRQDRGQAIKRYRELTSASARDAIWFVEALIRSTPAGAAAVEKKEEPSTGGFLDEEGKGVVEAIYKGEEVQAVSLCRDLTGLGLREARKFIDRLSLELYLKHPDRFQVQVANGKGSVGGFTSSRKPISALPEEHQKAIIIPIFEGRKLRAIEVYREITGAEIADAIKEVEAAFLELQAKCPERFKERKDESSASRLATPKSNLNSPAKPKGCLILFFLAPAFIYAAKLLIG